jgi:hypothetical protein
MDPAMDAEVTAIRDTIIIDDDFKITALDPSRKIEEVLDALKKNRSRLQELKADYTKVVKSEGGLIAAPSSKRRMIFYEIMRTYGAMEGLKDELAQRGARFDIDVNDHEHPNAAYKRLMTAKPNPFSSVVLSSYIILSVVVVLLWFLTSNEWRQIVHFGQERAAPLRPGR